jgi:hypothetical protein
LTDYSNGGSYTADYGMIDPNTQPASYVRAAGDASFSIPQAQHCPVHPRASVLSIATDRKNLFDPNTGIYCIGLSREAGTSVSVELITSTGVESWATRESRHGIDVAQSASDSRLNLMLVFSPAYGNAWLRQPFSARTVQPGSNALPFDQHTRDMGRRVLVTAMPPTSPMLRQGCCPGKRISDTAPLLSRCSQRTLLESTSHGTPAISLGGDHFRRRRLGL